VQSKLDRLSEWRLIGLQHKRGAWWISGGGPRLSDSVGLEQLVLKNLVENMLPKDSGVVFGNGTAGDIWRSFLADQLAAEVGKTVDLGVVKKPMTVSNSAAGQLSTYNSTQGFTTGGVPV
jgi:hypothetical protein